MLLSLFLPQMKRYLLLLVLFSFTISVYCQPLKFQKDIYSYGGSDFFEQSLDSTYLLSGYVSTDSSTFIMKIDNSDSVIWNYYYRKPSGYGIGADNIIKILNNNYIVNGTTKAFPFGTASNLRQLQSDGTPIWYKEYFINNAGWIVHSLCQNADSSLVLIGEIMLFPCIPCNISYINYENRPCRKSAMV
jgi:hypothetical protein